MKYKVNFARNLDGDFIVMKVIKSNDNKLKIDFITSDMMKDELTLHFNADHIIADYINPLLYAEGYNAIDNFNIDSDNSQENKVLIGAYLPDKNMVIIEEKIVYHYIDGDRNDKSIFYYFADHDSMKKFYKKWREYCYRNGIKCKFNDDDCEKYINVEKEMFVIKKNDDVNKFIPIDDIFGLGVIFKI